MPRYFFHVRDGRKDVDGVGTDLPTLAAAMQHAMIIASAIFNGHIAFSKYDPEWYVEVSNHDDLTLFRLNIALMLAPALIHLGTHQYGEARLTIDGIRQAMANDRVALERGREAIRTSRDLMNQADLAMDGTTLDKDLV